LTSWQLDSDGREAIHAYPATSLITGLAADLRLGGGLSQPWSRRAAALALICGGAAVGVLALRSHIARGVALAAVITLDVAVLGHTVERMRSTKLR
jgi:hypothetical protein